MCQSQSRGSWQCQPSTTCCIATRVKLSCRCCSISCSRPSRLSLLLERDLIIYLHGDIIDGHDLRLVSAGWPLAWPTWTSDCAADPNKRWCVCCVVCAYIGFGAKPIYERGVKLKMRSSFIRERVRGGLSASSQTLFDHSISSSL